MKRPSPTPADINAYAASPAAHPETALCMAITLAVMDNCPASAFLAIEPDAEAFARALIAEMIPETCDTLDNALLADLILDALLSGKREALPLSCMIAGWIAADMTAQGGGGALLDAAMMRSDTQGLEMKQ